MQTAWARIREPRLAVDPHQRLHACAVAFGLLMAAIFARSVQLELTQGTAFRAIALRPVRREFRLPAPRGQVFSHDGQLLACDRQLAALAIEYRWLQDPPDRAWLRGKVRGRLSAADRKDPGKWTAEESRFLAERNETACQLAALSGLTAAQWQSRARRIQQGVERISESVNRRRRESAAEAPPNDEPPPQTWMQQALRAVRDTLRLAMVDDAPQRITVAEELQTHVIAEGLSPQAAAEIDAHPSKFLGAKIIHITRRFYPAGSLAAHCLGHLAAASNDGRGRDGQESVDPDARVGATGIEKQYETLLRGRPGWAVEMTDHSGRVLESWHERESTPGRDVILTVDARLQQMAEGLLDSAQQRRAVLEDDPQPAGGAILVLDLEDGAVRAAAAAPRFDPNRFVSRFGAEPGVLNDPARPLFDRTVSMALPPGSVFKVLTAIALMESRTVDPTEPMFCQGFLHRPDQQRCEIFVRQGHGHGDVALGDALAQSCNVYFFAHAGRLGYAPLADWARRLGFGEPTGVDLPFEAAGSLPVPEQAQRRRGRAWSIADTQAVSVGQGMLTATPLQIVRLVAAVANGGQLITPHLLAGLTMAAHRPTADETAASLPGIAPPRPIAGLHAATIEVIREGLRRVVADEKGTAHGTVDQKEIAIAGKTGTAETGPGQAPHAWFAGYAPAESPKVALVIVLEHAGEAATAAGPLAKRLVLGMRELGML